ncbi:RING-type domain-containing protein [Psidium guajava]|nr:RING-type domain-containing protein [Psidium guajava]
MEDVLIKLSFHLESQPVPSITPQENQSQVPSSASSLYILTIAAVSIAAMAFLLLSYCLFLIKCCPSQRQLRLIRRFSLLRHQQQEDEEDSFIALSPTTRNQAGLDRTIIREIPAFPFRRVETTRRSFCGCTVCLNEFQEQDLLRVLPNCSHAFHSDCIDMWLQSNSRCPLCRMSISSTAQCPNNNLMAPSSSPQGSQLYSDMGDEEDYVVIELRSDEVVSSERQERSGLMPVQSQHNQRKLEAELCSFKKRCHRGSIKADEDINVRDQDQFIQPIRRSFSLDSAKDRNIFLAIQATIMNKGRRDENAKEECSSIFRR